MDTSDTITSNICRSDISGRQTNSVDATSSRPPPPPPPPSQGGLRPTVSWGGTPGPNRGITPPPPPRPVQQTNQPVHHEFHHSLGGTGALVGGILSFAIRDRRGERF